VPVSRNAGTQQSSTVLDHAPICGAQIPYWKNCANSCVVRFTFDFLGRSHSPGSFPCQDRLEAITARFAPGPARPRARPTRYLREWVGRDRSFVY